jgi:O-antigen/teichoic acid export membrane protein
MLYFDARQPGYGVMSIAVLKGSFTLGVADFSKKLLLAATVVLCARFLTANTFGDYVFLLTFYQIFAVLGGSGLPNSLVRSVARSGDFGVRSAVASILARLVYVVPTVVMMYAVMALMGFSTKYFAALTLLALLMVVRGATENIMSIFQGAEDQRSCAKLGVTQSAVTLFATLGVCLTSKSLLFLIGAHLLGGLASGGYGFFLLLLKDSKQQAPPVGLWADVRDLLKHSHWLNAGAFVASAYNRIDVVLLRRIVGAEAVALYGAPYRVLDLTQIIPSSLMAAILPRLCRSGEPILGLEQPRVAMRYLLTIALGLTVVLTVAAAPATFFLFGSKYAPSIPVLQILVWAMFPMCWNFVLNSQLIANSFDRVIFLSASIALVANIGLNLLLIPRFGYMACAAITVITELTLLGVNLWFVSKAGAVAWPEHLGRLMAATVFVAAFCMAWTHLPFRYSLVAIIFLFCGVWSVPPFWRDFSASDFTGRSEGPGPVRRIVG